MHRGARVLTDDPQAQEAASTGSEAQKVLINDQRGTRGRVGNIMALESSSMINGAQEAASAISRRKSPHQSSAKQKRSLQQTARRKSPHQMIRDAHEAASTSSEAQESASMIREAQEAASAISRRKNPQQ